MSDKANLTSVSSNQDRVLEISSNNEVEDTLFDFQQSFAQSVTAIKELADAQYIRAATELRGIKRQLVAGIVIAYEYAYKNDLNLVKNVIEKSRKESGYPSGNLGVKHGDFSLFARACLGKGVADFNKNNPPAITQLVDDAYAVWKASEDRSLLTFGNESKLAEIIREKTYAFFHKKLDNHSQTSVSDTNVVKLSAGLKDLTANAALIGREVALPNTDLMGEDNEVILVTKNGVCRVVFAPNAGAGKIVKAATFEGKLMDQLNSVLAGLN